MYKTKKRRTNIIFLLFFNFFFLLKIYNCIQTNTIEKYSLIILPLHIKNINSIIYYQIQVNLNNKVLNLILDINSDRIWIKNNKSDKIIDKNFFLMEIFNNKCLILSNEGEIKRAESFSLNNLTLNKILFEELEQNNKCFYLNGVIGLSKKSESIYLNFLKQLNELYLISETFSIYNNQLYIGNLTQYIKNKNIFNITLSDFCYKWSFILKGIYISDESSFKNSIKNNAIEINAESHNYLELSTKVSLESLYQFIIVDKYSMEFIQKNIFIDKSINCKFKDESFYSGIICEKGKINKLKDINIYFFINSNFVKISIVDLFVDYNNNEKYKLFGIINTNQIKDERISLGSLFYNNEKYFQIIFNANKGTLNVITNEPIYFVNFKTREFTKNNTFSKYDFFLSFSISTNFIGIAFVIYMILKEKRKNKLIF